MLMLGLNFGHDAAVCVVADGKLISYASEERLLRQKHATGIRSATLHAALSDAGVRAADIEVCAVTSTQSVEMLTGLCPELTIRYGSEVSLGFESPLESLIASHGGVDRHLAFGMRDYLPIENGNHITAALRSMLPEWRDYVAGQINATGFLGTYGATGWWNTGATLSALTAHIKEGSSRESMRSMFHHPATIELMGRELPAVIVDHHMAHAASVYYRSGFDEAAVFTHDGYGDGRSHLAGMFYAGWGHKLYPVAPHFLTQGVNYDVVAMRLGLGNVGGAGKLMGLAPYGKPVFFRDSFVGNHYDMIERFKAPLTNVWLEHCIQQAKVLGYDLGPLGDKNRILAPINVDIASSTQKLFEETYVKAATVLFDGLAASGTTMTNLCMSGGCALNCPSNSRVLNETPFNSIFIEPSCGDDGLAIGAVLHVYHNLMERPVNKADMSNNQTPYLGHLYTQQAIDMAVADHAGQVVAERVADSARAAAEELLANHVIAWYEGRSEVGPRALCHRSLLSDPRSSDNWARVNHIKGRENWRPFAPVVKEDATLRWFRGIPESAPYMLFTAQVTTDRLPAITHVDGSARIQTVTPESGGIYDILDHFERGSGVPVLMNTSLNGPGEPIVETPHDAIKFLLSSKVDCLLMGGWKLTRAY